MITLIDSFRHGEEHAPFNAAFIEVISECFKTEEIKIFSQKDHLSAIENIQKQNKANESNRSYCEVKGIDSKTGTSSLFLSYFIATIQDLKLLLKSRSKSFFFTTVNPLSLPFVKLLTILSKKKVCVVIHGELEYLNRENERSLKLQTRLLRKWYRFFFWKFLSKNFYYILLGTSIKANLESLAPAHFAKANFLTIDHPYFYNNRENTLSFSNPVRLGTVGHAAVVKGSHKIFELAKLKEKEILANSFELKIIGHVSPGMREFQNNLVETPENKEFLSRNEYEQKIMALHYIIFFYPSSMYEYIASGAFFDAIKFEKPIIALRNSFFESYFEKYGNLGFLAKNLTEISDYLQKVDSTIYNEQLSNLKKAKQDLSIKKISERFKTQLENSF
ncbi:glycosyltransferase [Mangrovibacterium diazotrophicum]|uniref:Glycosyltransferase involved in cell wall biosynthesis n=1 Tax=Mangrovibacterium diazotrophicum TaxID=1261403 RepID=A0A419W5Q5_9BACT|nr:glycosyltransferase [Mangrovibacterium diazotrophicum]RKD90775.1 glycosyltransferase involved in cell wall biosynthesis [Mangrovibacterium diazotrophicum]